MSKNFVNYVLALSKVNLKDKPLIVITAGMVSDHEEKKAWYQLQQKFLAKSSRSKQVIAEHSDHMINHHQPGIIIDAIREIVNDSLNSERIHGT
jgi:hypothetical protein